MSFGGSAMSVLTCILGPVEYAHPVPEWVRPSPVAVADFQWLAYRRYKLARHEVEAQRGEAMATAVSWLWGGITLGPGDRAYRPAGDQAGGGGGDVGGDGHLRRRRHH